MLKCQMSFLLNIYADWFCPTMIRYWLCNRKGNYMEQNLIRKQVKLICLYIQAEKFCSRELIFLMWPNLACWTFRSFYRWMMDVGCFQCCHTQVNCLPFTYRKYKNFDLLIILWNCHVCWKWMLLENLLETNEGDRSLVWNQFSFSVLGFYKLIPVIEFYYYFEVFFFFFFFLRQSLKYHTEWCSNSDWGGAFCLP